MFGFSIICQEGRPKQRGNDGFSDSPALVVETDIVVTKKVPLTFHFYTVDMCRQFMMLEKECKRKVQINHVMME